MAKTTLRKKSGAGGTTSLLSDYPTKLQYGTGTKTDTQINGTEEKAPPPPNPSHLYPINAQQRRQEHKMDKRQSLQ